MNKNKNIKKLEINITLLMNKKQKMKDYQKEYQKNIEKT